MTTLYVATLGGHISELVRLADRLPNDDAVWVTNDNAQTRELLRGGQVEMVPYIDERDVLGVARAVPQAWSLIRANGVDQVVSTGSAIALAYLPVASAMGLDAHYIECSARVESCSMTGRILCRTPRVTCWWQYPSPPPGFRYAGGVYDGFITGALPAQPDVARIVVTVGTTDWDFRRLVARLAEIVPPEAEVLWQTGATDVTGLDIDAKRLVPESVLLDAMERADVVISHAGAGSLSLALQAGKVPVFVPRRAKHHEHLDDHQTELARWAHDNALAVAVEADLIERHHLAAAAGRCASSTPVGELVLT